jgi:hypothetical protein
MRRVALTSSDNRNSVASSSAGGNENSSGSSTRKLKSKISAEPKMFSASSASSIAGGSGTMRIATIDNTAAANTALGFTRRARRRG